MDLIPGKLWSFSKKPKAKKKNDSNRTSPEVTRRKGKKKIYHKLMINVLRSTALLQGWCQRSGEDVYDVKLSCDPISVQNIWSKDFFPNKKKMICSKAFQAVTVLTENEKSFFFLIS